MAARTRLDGTSLDKLAEAVGALDLQPRGQRWEIDHAIWLAQRTKRR